MTFGACAVAVFSWLGSAQVAESAEPLPSVVLGEGHIGRFAWGARVEAPEVPRERGVCLSVSMVEPTPAGTAEGNEVAQCGPISPAAPMVESFTGGWRHNRRTAMAMLFAGGAEMLYLKLGGRPGRKLRLKALSAEELGSISAEPLSYLARAYAGSFCLRRFIAYDGAGAVLADSGHLDCRG